jgi:DNA-binding transcriptional MerR regulator
MTNEWPIQQIARLAGTTSRTLRHYDDIGLLTPSRVGGNGYRYYDERALVRLQRVLMLRDLGLPLPSIARVLDGQPDDTDALAGHLRRLREERQRLDHQIGAVEITIEKLKGGERLVAEQALDGFDHTRYRDEVVERWGDEAYAKSDSWYRTLSASGKDAIRQDQLDIQRAYAAAFAAGDSPDSAEVRDITRRHYDWVVVGWQGTRPTAAQFVGLGELYVADERFAANYGGLDGAAFVRDVMAAYADREL